MTSKNLLTLMLQNCMTSCLPKGYVEAQPHFHCMKKDAMEVDGNRKWKSPFVFHGSHVSLEQREDE